MDAQPYLAIVLYTLNIYYTTCEYHFSFLVTSNALTVVHVSLLLSSVLQRVRYVLLQKVAHDHLLVAQDVRSVLSATT